MDFRAVLSSSITLKELHLVRDEILSEPQNFHEVFNLIFEENSKSAWRAAWAIEKVAEANPELFSEQKILRLMNLSINARGGFSRSILAIIIHLSFPENTPVEFINACFDKMISMKEPVAVQALSMKLLEKLARKETAFIPEIMVTLQNVDLYMVSAGYLAARRKILASLSKVET